MANIKTENTEIKTVKRHCVVCGKETEQEKQKGWYLCLDCLMNSDSYFKRGKK